MRVDEPVDRAALEHAISMAFSYRRRGAAG
jgi:hypothetical protein